MSYRPLPDKLKIKNSKIDGQGLFTDKKIKAETVLGMSHIKAPIGSFENDVIRTPLGGFINHSENPNCEKYLIGNKYYIRAIRDINPIEELVLKYTFYKVV